MAQQEIPRYVNEKGEATELAKAMAAKFDVEAIQVKRTEQRSALERRLLTTAQNSLPGRENLNYPTDLNGPVCYEIKAEDISGGVLAVLARECPESELKEDIYAKLAYGNIFRLAGGNVNFIEPGDQVALAQGELRIARRTGSQYEDIMVPLYPWGLQPKAPAREPSRPTENEDNEDVVVQNEFPAEVRAALLTLTEKQFKAEGLATLSIAPNGKNIAFYKDDKLVARVDYEGGLYHAKAGMPGASVDFSSQNPVEAFEESANTLYVEKFIDHLLGRSFSGVNPITGTELKVGIDPSHGGEPFYLASDSSIKANREGFYVDRDTGFDPPFSSALDRSQVLATLNAEYKRHNPTA